MDGVNDLPLVEQFGEIQKAWEHGQHLAIRSPTGSGKSIGLPILLFHKKMVDGQILVIHFLITSNLKHLPKLDF